MRHSAKKTQEFNITNVYINKKKNNTHTNKRCFERFCT